MENKTKHPFSQKELQELYKKDTTVQEIFGNLGLGIVEQLKKEIREAEIVNRAKENEPEKR